jgi:hypothetical protein
MDHLKQVARLGIAFRPEHTRETLTRLVIIKGQFLESDRRINILTQHHLAGFDITGKQTFDPFLVSSGKIAAPSLHHKRKIETSDQHDDPARIYCSIFSRIRNSFAQCFGAP